MRVCRRCAKTEKQVRFYDPKSIAGIAAGSMCQPCWVWKSVEWRRNNKDKWNRQRHQLLLQRQHGVTEEQFNKLYANPKCAGCGVTTSQKGKRLAFDHSHVTGQFRGLLCHDCNRTIATAHDDPMILRRLAKYLDRSK